MADGKVEGAELKQLIRLGNSNRLGIAYCPDKKGNDFLLIDKKKKPKVLGAAAKKAGTGKKVLFGTFVMNDGVMEITSEETLPAVCSLLRKYLKSQGIGVEVILLGDQGSVPAHEKSVWDDDQTETETPSPGTDANQNAKDEVDGDAPKPESELLAERIKAFQSVINTVSEANAAKLNKAKTRAVSQIKAGDLGGAEKTIVAMEGAVAKRNQKAAGADQAIPAQAVQAEKLLEQVRKIGGPAGDKLSDALTKVADLLGSDDLKGADTLLARIKDAIEKRSPGSTSDQAVKWAGTEAKLQPVITRLMQNGHGDMAAINKVFSFAQDQAKAGNYDKAMAAAARVVDLIKQARTQDTGSDDNAAYSSSRQNWISSRAGMREEMKSLKSAIDKATAGQPGLEDASAKSGGIFEYLDGFDSSLEDALDQLTIARNDDQRKTLKSTARRIIDQYRGVLDTDFFQAVDRNGFVKTNIRSTALAALQKVNAALET